MYGQIMRELELQRQRRRMPMWKLDDVSGIQDGYYAKMLHFATPSGKRARWDTLDLVVAALFPKGVRVQLIAKRKSLPDVAGKGNRNPRHMGNTKFTFETRRKLRAHLKSIASMGGKARQAKLSPAERKRLAKRAIEVRWSAVKAAVKGAK